MSIRKIELMFKFEINWGLLFMVINAIGSLATFGAFLFLFFKDKHKQGQIDKLTDIFLELQKQNNLSEKKFKLSIKPNLHLHGSSLNGTSGEFKINLNNKGENAKITKMVLNSNDIISHSECLPYYLEKDASRFFFYRTTGQKNINDCEYEIKIIYEDKAQNNSLLILEGVGMKPRIIENAEILST